MYAVSKTNHSNSNTYVYYMPLFCAKQVHAHTGITIQGYFISLSTGSKLHTFSLWYFSQIPTSPGNGLKLIVGGGEEWMPAVFRSFSLSHVSVNFLLSRCVAISPVSPFLRASPSLCLLSLEPKA